MSELYIGLMSGTSADAVDAALVSFARAGVEMLATLALPLPAEVRAAVLAFNQSGDDEIQRLGWLEGALADLFAQAARQLLIKAGVKPSDVAAIGLHGQTLRHAPESQYPYTLQVGDPSRVALKTGVAVVADFRRGDLAAGGQGAPLAPLLHQAVFAKPGVGRAIVNIGGIANVSILTEDAVLGYDTGPGNGLLDAWAEQHLGQRFDQDGAWAAQGKIQPALLEQWLADPYFSQLPPKSTGRDVFNLAWLDVPSDVAAVDIQATLLALTVQTIAQAVAQHAVDGVWVCGGGAHNLALMQSLQAALGERFGGSTAELGIEPDWVEAVLFAWLAQQRLAAQPLPLASITGGIDQVLGGVYLA